MSDYEIERERALQEDAMTQGEWMSCVLTQYAGAHGEMHPDVAWILTPYDTWQPNPHYKGPKQPHPEDDYAQLSDAELEAFQADEEEFDDADGDFSVDTLITNFKHDEWEDIPF